VILLAEKNTSRIMRPVGCWIRVHDFGPELIRKAAVRTILPHDALHTGLPVSRFHTIVSQR